jgi:hypothetical protein
LIARTLLPDERVIAVVGVVCVARHCGSAVADDAEVEF